MGQPAHPILPMLIATLVALAVSGVLALPILKLLIRLKSRQTISAFVPEHAAKQGTPTMGGIIIVAGFVAACVFLAIAVPDARSKTVSTLILFLGFAVVGFVDDFVIPRMMPGKRGLGWTQKLVMEIVVATASAWIFLEQPTTMSIVVTVLIILFFSNGYNFADGLDWLAGTVLLALLPGFMFIFGSGNWILTTYCFALAAAALPFMALNRPPARVFMGDVGALAIGAVLGLLASLPPVNLLQTSGSGDSDAIKRLFLGNSLAVLFLSVIMFAEIVPVPLQILSVKLRKGKRIFPKTPIHHAFQVAGWTEQRIVCLFAAIQLIGTLGAVGIAMNARDAAQHDPQLVNAAAFQTRSDASVTH